MISFQSLSLSLRALPWVIALASILTSTVGCSPIVGGACVPGTIVCDGRCVDPETDELACGGCGQACGPAAVCMAGLCVEDRDDTGVPDAEVPDAWVADAADAGVDGGDASHLDAGPMFDAGSGDAGALDAPGLDAPGLDAPGLDAPGVDAPGLDAPGLDAPGLDGIDVGSLDAGPMPDADGLDAGPLSDAGGSDAGPLVCDLGSVACDGLCVDLSTDVRSCGECGVACGRAQLCAAGICVDRCAPPTVACGSACVDLDSDPDNCGACGRVCPTGLCSMGMCTGALAGHLVVIGHDYEVNRAAMDRVLGNSVFLSSASPVRVLAYEGGATVASVTGVERAVSNVASIMGRAVSWTPALEPDRVSADLRSADVFLVHAQRGGTDAELAALGVSWSRALSTFLERGGVVVVLDVMAPHRGTWTLLSAAGLLACDRIEDATSATVSVVAPWDGVVIGVPLTYRAERTSVRFVGADLPVVARDSLGPVVLHRTVVPMAVVEPF